MPKLYRVKLQKQGAEFIEAPPLFFGAMIKKEPHKEPFSNSGAAEVIRTPDPRITNALLYRLSYSGVITPV